MTIDKLVAVTVIMLAMCFVTACGPQEPKESMTSGHAEVGANDAVKELGWRLSRDFQTQNKGALIDIVGGSAREWIDSLANKRIEQALLDRTLSKDESLALSGAGLKIYSYPVATYPVYLLVTRENPVEKIDSASFRDILSGTVTDWHAIGGPKLSITTYLPLPGDGSWESLMKFYGRMPSVSGEVCSTYSAMIDKADLDPGALLVCALPYDTEKLKRLVFVRDGLEIPANVKQILEEPIYPFRIDVTYLTTRMKQDVAAGFLTYITGNVGQRRIMSWGYRPASVPVRVVKMR